MVVGAVVSAQTTATDVARTTTLALATAVPGATGTTYAIIAVAGTTKVGTAPTAHRGAADSKIQ